VTISVRRAVGDDLPVVLGLVGGYCAADGHEFDAATATAGLGPLLDDDAVGVVWLAEDDGAAVGYAAVTWGWSIEIGGFEVVLDELYVTDRGRGIGSMLLAHLEDDCRARGVRRIFLETERPNEDARRLYRRHGYADDDSIWLSKELT
jgi:GNAT superfamily N-acetyltransferase